MDNFLLELKEKLEVAFDENMWKDDIKYMEIALQKVIENICENKEWWQVCEVPIYQRLLDRIPRQAVIYEIVASISKNIRNSVEVK